MEKYITACGAIYTNGHNDLPLGNLRIISYFEMRVYFYLKMIYADWLEDLLIAFVESVIV